MRIAKALPFLVPFTLARIALRGSLEKCGSYLTEQEKWSAEAKLAAQRPSAPTVNATSGPIPVYWHVINAGNTPELGNTPSKQIDDTITILNRAFSPNGPKFSLVKVTRVLNVSWFNNVAKGNTIQTVMKKSLRVGSAGTLNIYTVGLNQGKNVGYATFPAFFDDNPVNDGVVVRHTTLAGGSHPVYNLGMTLVHEVGHWLGLHHIFEGGCTEPGDMVSDTPQSATELYGCQDGVDSCPRSAGKDPLRNYMSYSDDSCLDNFTPGQIARIKTEISRFRAIHI